MTEQENTTENSVEVKEVERKYDPWNHEMRWGSCFSNVLSLFGRDNPSATLIINYAKLENLKFIGSGSQGMIYSGFLDGEIVAVKKVSKSDLREAELLQLKQLKHESIVAIRGICNEEPDFCIIMEYCQYGSLFSFIHSASTLAPATVAKWAMSVANGMAYLHNNKVIHRDLKSPNILLADDLTAKVSDFGTSRVWDTMSTNMKTFTGTVPWMAPEVIRNEPYNEKVDVWSFGVVLWELMTQAVPYKSLDSPAIMWGVGCNTLNLPIPTHCPESMRLLMGQCFNRVPENRPPFKIIAAHLEVAAEDITHMSVQEFSETVSEWRDEVYEQQLTRANEIYMDVCALRLKLETREGDIKLRESELDDCRCRRPVLRPFPPQSSTDKVTTTQPKKAQKPPQNMLVQYVESDSRAVTSTISAEDMKAFGIEPTKKMGPKMPVTKIDTVVEYNGNVDADDDSDMNDNDGLTAKERIVGRVDV